jgi:hypothetical protein
MSTFMGFLNLPSQRVLDPLLQRAPNQLPRRVPIQQLKRAPNERPRRRNSNSELDEALEGRNYVIFDRRELGLE